MIQNSLQAWHHQLAGVSGRLAILIATQQGMRIQELRTLAARLHNVAKSMEELTDRWLEK